MVTTSNSARLRRSDCSGPGLHRARRGRGFSYVDERGERVDERERLERIRGLAIPPAWSDVWICADPLGHLQATGIDAAGRKQYLYHPSWQKRREREKFRRMVAFARALPPLRRHIGADLRGPELTRERVLACAARLLDIGLFRIGGEEYADDDGGLGLATLEREHVQLRDGAAVFDYRAKGGARRVHVIEDARCIDVLRALTRSRRRQKQLLAYRNGRSWVSVRSHEINEYLKQHLGEEFSAKDFRTWNATVLAAVALAASEPQARSRLARQRVIKRALADVAELLGNTPAVARRSYVDPRVIDRYLSGHTISSALEGVRLNDDGVRARTRIERAVIELLEE
jgi:DNA topoisomerase I